MTTEEQNFWHKIPLKINCTNHNKSSYYCDWITPKAYYLDSKKVQVTGEVGFLTPNSRTYDFTLTFCNTSKEVPEINWDTISTNNLKDDWVVFFENSIEINM